MGARIPHLGLLARFSLLTLICLVALGVALFIVLRGDIRQRALEDARRQAEHLATDFGIDVLPEEELQVGLAGETLDRLDRVVQGHRLADQIATAKIFDRRGRMAYSLDRRDIGQQGEDSVQDALRGRTVAHIEVGADHVDESHGQLYEAYVPMRFSPSGPVEGVFEVYLPYTPVAARIAADTERLVAVLVAGLALLCLLLLPIVARASSRLRQQAEQSRHQALHDDLTGVANRRQLLARLEQEIRRGRRFGLIMLDLDRFRDVNDALGHGHGDSLLREVAARLQGAVRHQDLLARLGGDEFAMLILDVGSPEMGAEVAQRISAALHGDFVVGGVPLYVEASIGIAIHPDHGTEAEALVQAADIAMHMAKRTATDYELYEPERDRRGPDRVARLSELRRALDLGELVLHYQPKVDLRTGRVSGVEALVRWDHPKRGLIPPAEFLPLAEHTGLIAPLTSYVLDAALRQCRTWLDEGIDMPVAVNVSERSLLDVRFPDEVGALLARWEVPEGHLQLELTERSVIGDLAVATGVVEGLHALGVRLSVDDFGTGYSSLSRLRDLPLNELKIDRSFVTEMAEDGQGVAIVRSAIDLGHHLGLEVVAEGVERADTLEELRALGCDSAQGYLLLRPLPADEVTAWLRGVGGGVSAPDGSPALAGRRSGRA
jgi:diguanylate cyclase (GGDEF)-like protein